jgi:hypothetical protein
MEIEPKDLRTIKYGQGLAAKVLGGMIGGGTALLTANPVLGAVVGASVAHTLETVGKEVIERHLTSRQEARVGRAIAIAYGKLVEHERGGRCVRNDDFFSPSDGDRADGAEVTEAALQAAMNSAEERKVDFIASLLANVATSSEIGAQTAHLLIDQAQRLTFRSYILLEIASDVDRFDFGSRHEQADPRAGLTAELQGLELEAYELIHAGLAVLKDSEHAAGSLAALGPDDVDPGKIRLTALGRLLYDNLSLAEMEKGPLYDRVVKDLGNLALSARSPNVIKGGRF